MIHLNFNSVELDAPEDWIDVSVVTLVSPEAKAFRPNIVVTRDELEEAPDLVTYAKGEAKELQKAMKKYVLHKEEETVVGGRNGYLLEHSFRSPENVQVRQMQIYAVRGRMVFTLALTSAEAEFESCRDRFAQIARSFKLA
jgi:hypothetical protein